MFVSSLPYDFTIEKCIDGCIIFKSKYHYWRIVENREMYFLHHKYNENDNFHIQRKLPFYSLRSIYKYVKSHDEWFAANHNTE